MTDSSPAPTRGGRIKTADLLVRALEHEGVRFVFGVPGEENLDVVEALRESSIQLIVTRHEQAAGFMAATVGRLTGEACVALSTLGPGATNLATAAAYATLAGMPMFMLTGQKPIKTSKQGHFQIIDVVDLMRPLTKYTRQVVDGGNVPSKVREAFRIAQQERPGAVHLELPEDVAQETLEEWFLYPRETIRRPAAEAKAVRLAAERLAEARRPLLLIGAGANRSMTGRMLQRFVDRFQIPFFTTQMGKGVLDERQELCLGTAALSEHDELHRAIDHADVILNVGHDVVEKPPFFMHPDGVEVIHLNYLPAQVDPVYFPRFQVVGDVANAIWQLCETLEPAAHWERECFLEVKRALQARMAEQSDSDAYPPKPQRIVADVRRALPEDGIVALDNGMYKLWFARNYPAYGPNTMLLDNALATMGAGLPSAMAAALVYPDRKVVAVTGDGGFMMCSQELETAVRLGLDLVVLVVRDEGLNMVRWKQERMGMSDFGLGFGNPDFVAYARAFGAQGSRVERTEDLEPTLRRCLEQGGVQLVDVPIDYSENVLLTRELDSDGGEAS